MSVPKPPSTLRGLIMPCHALGRVPEAEGLLNGGGADSHSMPTSTTAALPHLCCALGVHRGVYLDTHGMVKPRLEQLEVNKPCSPTE